MILLFGVFVVTFCWVELLFFVLRRYGRLAAAGISLIGLVVGSLLFYFGVADYANGNKSISLMVFGVVACLVPVLVLHLIVLFARHLAASRRHVLAVGVGLVNGFVWPFVVLLLGCFTQLDCI